MKSKPILFSGPMVRAILDGRKTQTRRIVKPQPPFGCGYAINGAQSHALCHAIGDLFHFVPPTPKSKDNRLPCPYGQPGDRLLVKEHAWMFCERRPNGVTKTGRQKWHYVPLRAAPVLHCESHPAKPAVRVVHPETGNEWGWRKKLGRFLPSWAVRITLEIVSVRVERLQDISEVDAEAEGMHVNAHGVWHWRDDSAIGGLDAVDAYRLCWESINGPDSWEANPWVWVVEFKRIPQ